MNCRCSVHTTGGFSFKILIMRNVVTATMPHIPKHQNVWIVRAITVNLQVWWYHFTRNCKSADTTRLETACLLSLLENTSLLIDVTVLESARLLTETILLETAFLVTDMIRLGIACLLFLTTLLGTASFLNENIPLQTAVLLLDNYYKWHVSNWYHCIRNYKSVSWYHSTRNCMSADTTVLETARLLTTNCTINCISDNWYHSTRNCISADTTVLETVILLIPLLETACLLILLY
jgi:hypothetical protein